jgi:very-short-patch-repair endonuclease
MRREPTDAEAAMWRLLRDRRLAAFKFRRQVPFQSYILDFVCFEQRLVVEVDRKLTRSGQASWRAKASGLRAAGITKC